MSGLIYTFDIEMDAYLTKYLNKKYCSETITLSADNMLGKYILAALSKRTKHWYRYYQPKKKVEKSTIRFTLSDKYKQRVGEILNEQETYEIIQITKEMFLNEFYTFIDCSVLFGEKNILRSVGMFLDKYDIYEDELSIKTMRKSYYRYKESQKVNTDKH